MMTRARRVAAVVGLAVAASFALVAVPSAAAAAEPVPSSLWDEAAASAAARQHGQRVLVASKTSEYSQVFANPDGTLTWEESLQPLRVRDGETGWRPVDTTLKAAQDGRVQATATVHRVSFSAGGDAPLAELDSAGRRISVTWPDRLPEPVLDGATATYPEVLPGVDVKVTATAAGFTQLVVVKTREAAANPVLSSLRFGLEAQGLTVRENDAGAMEAVDADGAVVFTAPTPTMWDSSSSSAMRAESAEGNVSEAKQARMAANVDGSALTLTPDRGLLEAADTVYPVFIDPSWTGVRNNWTSVWKQFPTTSYWNASTINWDDDEHGVARAGYEAQDGNTVRSFFQLYVYGVAYKQIVSATMRITQTHSWGCSSTPVELWSTDDISSSTTWNNQPALRSLLATKYTALGNANCGQADGDVEFDVTGEVAYGAARAWNYIAVGLKAPNEGDTNQWKRYRNNPVLAITYNTPPGAPTELTVAGRAAADPRPVVGSPTPTLRAKVHDADGGDSLEAWFDMERRNTDGTWTWIDNPHQASLRSGDVATVPSPQLEDGGVYRFHVRSFDGRAWGAYSDYLEFEVDTTPPQEAPLVSSSDYGSDLNLTYGAIGKTGEFTFAANGETSIRGYRWGWNDPPTTEVIAPSPGASVTIPITPPAPDPANPTRAGLLRLFVQSFNGATTPSPVTEYQFKVGSATGPNAQWGLSDAAGAATAADASGNGHDAALSGAATGAAGRMLSGPFQTAPTTASFDGVDDSGSAGGPVVDTATSFTVAAWVKPAVTDDWRTIAATTGENHSAFFLRTNGSKWVFSVMGAVDQSSMPVDVYGTSAPVAGVWTHVAGVYDRGAKQIRLYVNGVLEGTAAVDGVFAAAGPLTFGVGRWSGSPSGWWSGSLADVTVWDRVLSAAEVEPMAATLVGRWRLDGDGYDSSVFGHDAEPAGTVTWQADRHGNAGSAVSLDGTGWLATTGPVLDTSQSYTVSAWLNLAHTDLRWTTAVAQDGQQVSHSYLGTGDYTEWSMDVRSSDSTGTLGQTATGGIAQPGVWTHVVGVYDANAKQVRLYVNGELVAAAPAGSTWSASGVLRIGASKWGNAVDAWPWIGAIDDVRTYQGVLTASTISALAQS